MKITCTPEEWHTLFGEQQRSGLNKTQFCRQHGITRSAFSNARRRLSVSNIPSTSFAPALAPDSGTYTAAPQAERQLTLMLPGATLSLPVDISPRWLATLLREMVP